MAKRAPYTGFTVKDVRRLRTCVLCAKLGIYQPTNPALDIPLVICVHEKAKVKKAQRSYCHPRCYVEQMGVFKLEQIDRDELDAIRICDVSPFVLQRILKIQRERR